MDNEKTAAIIIINWNGIDDTIECLNSLKNSSHKNYKIVLVDNGSNNSEGSKLKEMFPYIHLIQNQKNRGFAGGNNDGMNWALNNGFGYLINLNNDCIVEGAWLNNLIEGVRAARADYATSRIMFYPEKT